jgi:hypothetical protein
VGLAGLKGRHGELDQMPMPVLSEYERAARCGAQHARAAVQQAYGYGDWERGNSREQLTAYLDGEADAAAAWLRERAAPGQGPVVNYPDGPGAQSPMPSPNTPPSPSPSPSGDGWNTDMSDLLDGAVDDEDW